MALRSALGELGLLEKGLDEVSLPSTLLDEHVGKYEGIPPLGGRTEAHEAFQRMLWGAAASRQIVRLMLPCPTCGIASEDSMDEGCSEISVLTTLVNNLDGMWWGFCRAKGPL